MSEKKRSDQRHGHRTKAEQAKTTKIESDSPVVIPHADPGWSKMARDMYMAIKKSPQSKFYTNADWAYAKLVMFVITRVEADPTAMKLQALDGMLAKLLVDEVSRRKANIEITQKEEAPDNPEQATILSLYREQAQ